MTLEGYVRENGLSAMSLRYLLVVSSVLNIPFVFLSFDTFI